MAARALLFDLDGTIWHSYPWYAQILEARFGLQKGVVENQLRSGISIVSILRERQISTSSFRNQCIHFVDKLTLYPAVREIFDKLTARRTALAVVTNLPRWLASPLLYELGLTRFFTEERYSSGKPSPHSLEEVVSTIGLERKSPIFYVGDTQRDSVAAKKADLFFAWASYGYGDSCPEGTNTILKAFEDVLHL